MLKPYYTLLCLLSMVVLHLDAQELPEIDSLVTLLSKQSHDSSRSRIMYDIASEIHTGDTLITLEYLEGAKRISTELKDTKGLGRYHYIRGKLNSYFGNYQLSIQDFNKALKYFSEANELDSYYETVKDKGNVFLFTSDYERAMNNYADALSYYRSNKMEMGISRVLNNMGIIHKNRGEYVEAFAVYEESVIYLDTLKDAYDISQAYINMGNIFVHLGSYQEAIEYFQKSLEIAEKENYLENISLCLSNMGVVQNKCYNFSEALNLYQRSLEVSESIGDLIQISNCLINIGMNFADMDQPEKGRKYVEEGMAIKLDLGDRKAISNCYIHLAEIHVMLKDYDRAIELFRSAIPEKKDLGDQEGLARCYLGLGSLLFDRAEYTNAREMTHLALNIAIMINAKEHIVKGYETLGKIALTEGDFESAYNFTIRHHQYSDSILNETTAKAVMEMEVRNRSSDLKREIENLLLQSDLTAALMRKRSAYYYSFLGITFLLATGLILVAYFLRKLRTSSQKLEEKNLVITSQNITLDNLVKTKDQMMSIIAHDLRGTIGNQLSAVAVLHKIEGDEGAKIDRKKLLGDLKRSSSYSLELLENLLHWTRLKENESFFYPEEVRMESLISNCIGLFDESAKNKNISFNHFSKESITARLDIIMMETIIRNLISNAIKFSNPGGQITIGTDIMNENIYFRVTDQGIGMTEEQIVKISGNGGFTRRGTANEKGAGIGLTLVREFTAFHHGKLNITSEPNKGSTFEVAIPFRN